MMSLDNKILWTIGILALISANIEAHLPHKLKWRKIAELIPVSLVLIGLTYLIYMIWKS